MKLKDRIIHFLGGYTKSEYEANNNTKVRFPVIYNEKPIKTIKCSHRIDVYNPYIVFDKKYEDFIKVDLARKIGDEMLKNDCLLFSTPESGIVTAMAKVVDYSDISLA